ncbi:hypothetical protein KEF29_35205 [Streptomyces tuirus]|uniref:Uncharacterized protein n=1 Tax=Streptomyces tuirus TaxID=68278 RepID=A0A941FMD9_9ACTN|nr:hypothetical protein [Streptomyces tuirus]
MGLLATGPEGLRAGLLATGPEGLRAGLLATGPEGLLCGPVGEVRAEGTRPAQSAKFAPKFG